jgi:hypothetical protein
MPTLTIVALAFRLAHHLRSLLAEGDVGGRSTPDMTGQDAIPFLPAAARSSGEVF